MIDPAVILDQVKGSLNNWGVVVRDITLASQSENIVYQVTTVTGTRYAFRIHRPGYHTFQELLSEHRWTNALAKAGFLVPNIMPTTIGEFYLPIEVNGGTRYAELIEWLDGKSLHAMTQENPSTEFLCSLLVELGQLMAALHEHSRQWQPGRNFARHKLDVDGFFGDAPFWGRYWDSPFIDKTQQRLLLTSQQALVDALETLGYSPNVFGMIHGDLHEHNVLLNSNTMHIIDFDDSGFGWYLYDIAVALFEYQSRADFDEVFAALLTGYEQVRTLTNEQRALIPMFIHIRARAIIGWATERQELDNAERIKKLVHYTCQEASAYL
jgi:Ser/Thr protein kinase RdoA (MazF antagonist)